VTDVTRGTALAGPTLEPERRRPGGSMRERRRPTASRKGIILFLLLGPLLPLATGWAQQGGSGPPETGAITGVVTAQETGNPLAEARVTVAGGGLSAVTGPNGRYTIAGVPPGTYRLTARLIGYALGEASDVLVSAGQTDTAHFQLRALPVTLQDVVVVGYGTQIRKDITGSVASVAGEDLQKTPKVNAVEALKGRVAGVDIVTSGNKPGDGITIRIRGERSLTASNDPLYVLDGIPMSGGIGDVNPNDIESIEVLKDASATAIYGSRGASGVVLITTRQGRSGQTTVTYDTYGGMQEDTRRMPMMNGPQFAQYKREASRTVGKYQCPTNVVSCAHGDSVLFWPVELASLKTGRWTDWQNLVLQPGSQINNEVRITGGDEKTRFTFSGAHLDQRGIVKGQDFGRWNARFNFDHHVSPRLRLGTSTLLVKSDQHIGRGDGVYSEALGNDPLGMPYDSLGNLIFKPTPDGQRVNPLSDVLNQRDDRSRTRVFGTMYADYNVNESLNWRVNFGADITFFRRGQFWGAQTQAMQGSGANGSLQQNRTLAYTLDNILTYRHSLGESQRVEATLLYSIQDQQFEDQTTSATGLPYELDQYYDLGSAAHIGGTSNLTEWKLQSYMARFNYALKDRYLLTLTGRVDGSSRLAPGHKYQLFPSVALAWRLSEEDFIQRLHVFSDLKLRLSYGQTGNTAISPYQTEGCLSRTIYSFGDQPAIGYRPGCLPNPDLTWERTSQADVGLEFGLLSGRLSGSVDVYRASTSDLLMSRQLAGTNGYSSILQNVGSTLNTGAEVALNSQLVQNWHGLGWDMRLTWGMNRNRIVSLFGGNKDDVGNRWFIGYPISVYYDYRFAGIWQLRDSVLAKTYKETPGQIRVVDVNGDGKIDANDRVILGTPYPEWTGSLTSRFDWSGFDLSVMAVARLGGMANDQFRKDQNVLAGRYNNLAVNYWLPTNPSNTDPRPNVDQEFPLYNSALGFEDGSFIRVRSITLGYTVPGGRFGPFRGRSLRVYATALDPFLFTRFQGLDPESATNAGVPAYRTMLMGLTVGL
jgi:TonB-linked SusC/RagA family outer membrane protein